MSNKKKSFKRLLVASLVAIVFIIGVIPKLYKSRVENDAVKVLQSYQLKPIEKYGEYSHVYAQQDWIVENLNGVVDTVGVTLKHGELILTTTLDERPF